MGRVHQKSHRKCRGQLQSCAETGTRKRPGFAVSAEDEPVAVKLRRLSLSTDTAHPRHRLEFDELDADDTSPPGAAPSPRPSAVSGAGVDGTPRPETKNVTLDASSRGATSLPGKRVIRCRRENPGMTGMIVRNFQVDLEVFFESFFASSPNSPKFLPRLSHFESCAIVAPPRFLGPSNRLNFLESLRFDGCSGVCSLILRHLVGLRNLKEISFRGCKGVDPEQLLDDEFVRASFLGTLPELERPKWRIASLDLSETPEPSVTLACMVRMGMQPTLTHLYVEKCPGLRYLSLPTKPGSRYEKLRYVSVAGNASARPLDLVGSCALYGVREVNASGCGLTDEEVGRLVLEYPGTKFDVAVEYKPSERVVVA